MTDSETPRGDERALGLVRLGIGLVQGLALYLLYCADDSQSWPATDPRLFFPLVYVAVFIPLLLLQSLGNLRARTLILWAIVATVLVAGLAWYDIWRAWPLSTRWLYNHEVTGPRPSFATFFFTTAGLFIAHALVSGADADRQFRATYRTHFDTAWKLGLQVALSAAFVGVFWLLLWLGASLFELIKLDFLSKLIEHAWFSIPVTTLATAAALHVTDVRANLVRGARTLVLVLLSWLLPLMALFAVGFLASLVFTGLEPLWSTRRAAAILLTAAAVLVILINATYQDGESESHRVAALLRQATRIAAVVLVPIGLLAGYAIFLRVRQYGWTVDRVTSTALAGVALGYAVGYALAAVLPGGWMNRIEGWNFVMSLAVLAVLLALFSPLADPARISVSSQMAPLRSGLVAAAKFDFNYLRREGARFGYEALTDLAAHGSSDTVRHLADAALHDTVWTEPKPPVELARNVTVFPKGQALPVSFLREKWTDENLPSCLTTAGNFCEAYLVDLDGDGQTEILLSLDGTDSVQLFALDADGAWSLKGSFSPTPACGNAREALRVGSVRMKPGWGDLSVSGIKLIFNPIFAASAPCPSHP